MPITLPYPTLNGDQAKIFLEPGVPLFILGANGSGKSSLIIHFARSHPHFSRKISAHRQNWMASDALDLTPAGKAQLEKTIQSADTQAQSRYRDQYALQRASMAIFELIDAENVRARKIAAAVDAGDMEKAKEIAQEESPISVINELFRLSNIFVRIVLRDNERLMASKNDDGPDYSAAELSDGERNALLIAANVLTAKPGTLLLIDEPERHLHRSIIAPLLRLLFERRSDCGFVVSTHDLDLPLAIRGARTLLLRSCKFNGQAAHGWEADELGADTPIDESLKRDLIGARRKILFVEGTEGSLDKSLYSLIFPNVSVIAKGSCLDVEQAVAGSKGVKDFHWLHAFGIVDGDGYEPDQLKDKRSKGVYALPYYSVEAIYYHPNLIERIAERQTETLGGEGCALAKSAIESAVAAVADCVDRLSCKVAKKMARRFIMEQIPNDDILLAGQEISISNNAPCFVQNKRAELEEAIEKIDWDTILAGYPVRETPALDKISSRLGFRNRSDYQRAVRQLLTRDPEALEFVRSLFDDLPSRLL